jgi:hypothetical protein
VKAIDDQVTIIIRSVGERTEQLCYECLKAEVPASNITIVREIPFSAALRKSYRVGIREGRPWTLCIDADVLVRPGAVTALLQAAEQEPPTCFEIQGMVEDKLFGCVRSAGNRLYRTRLLNLALQHIPDERESQRPETSTVKAMASEGYLWVLTKLFMGTHDYEQYYRDLYRKGLIHAQKHEPQIPHLKLLWESRAKEDADCKVLLLGLEEGVRRGDCFTLNAHTLNQDACRALEKHGFQEKRPLEGLCHTTVH